MLKFNDITKKIIFTSLLIILYKILSSVILIGIDPILLKNLTLNNLEGNITSSLFSGGSMGILALGLSPYIQSTILMQIISSKFGFADLQELKRNKKFGNIKLNQITKYLAIFIAFNRSIFHTKSIAVMMIQNNLLMINLWVFYLISITLLVTGSIISIWFADQISKHGIGQGISIILLVNIISSYLQQMNNLKIWKMLYTNNILTIPYIFLIFLFYFSILTFIVFIESTAYKIKVFFTSISPQNQISNLKLRINSSGVMSIFMTEVFIGFLGTINELLRNNAMAFFTDSIERTLSLIQPNSTHWVFYCTFSILVIIFTVAQISISFDCAEVSDHLQKSNIIVENTRPGNNTTYLLESKIFNIVILNALYLLFLCVLLKFIIRLINYHIFHYDILSSNMSSILIIVSITQTIYKCFIHYDYHGMMNKYYNKTKNIDSNINNDSKKETDIII